MVVELGQLTVNSFRADRSPLLHLSADVLDRLRQEKLEYTKGQAIARVKDAAQRATRSEQAISENPPLSEIKARGKELKPDVELNPEKMIALRWTQLGKQLHTALNHLLIHTCC